jgi:F0F1-type ATP synthase membrane subunit b/b'
MDTVLGIFNSLGVNSTIWIQLGIFLVAYALVYLLIAKPYYAAFLERQGKTQGNQDLADTLTAQSRELEAAFQRKARSLNLDIKDVYDKARSEATREQDKITTMAREKAKAYIDQARSELTIESNRAREALIKEAPLVGQAIADRLLAKEM